MAPTLQDVSLLLGLPITGGATFPQESSDDWREDLLARFQGVLPPAVVAGYYVFPEAQRHDLSLRWLSQFRYVFDAVRIGSAALYINAPVNIL